MHTMNTDQQTYYPNPTSAAFFPATGIDQRKSNFNNANRFQLLFFRIYNEKSIDLCGATYDSTGRRKSFHLNCFVYQ